ncbi:MAG: outer membrane protein transport protein [Planctomycetaceae bacterium]|nr:outer membrane protein transport protein [Planctomycetaceae bacterium]
MGQFASRYRLTAVFLASLFLPASANAQGIVLPGEGGVNRSMAGAGTATALDSLGGLYWNPATIGALPKSRVDIGNELLSSRHTARSTIQANAFGPGVPAATLSGGTRSDTGLSALPSIGIVYQPEESPVPVTYGLGLLTIGGYFTNFKGDLNNPIFTPPPPNGFGIGPVYSRLALLQLAPTVAVRLTERIMVGVSPTVNIADLQGDVLAFAPPDDANGDGFATYPPGTHARLRWGLGIHAGVFYQGPSGINLGFSFKSPQWFERFQFESRDELGAPRTIGLDLTYPMILSWGISYTGYEGLVLAADMRWINYRGARAFGDPAGIDAFGAVTGLGWDDVFYVGIGAQYQLNEALALRLGYSYNTNPIDDAVTFFNLEAPGIYQHGVYLGASMQVTKAIAMHASYVYAFPNSIHGPIFGTAGPIPGTDLHIRQIAESFVIGISAEF